MRKLSNITLLIIYALLFMHVIMVTLKVLGVVEGGIPTPIKIIFLASLAIHVIISFTKFGSAIVGQKKHPEGKPYGAYPQLNRKAVLRRMSGIVLFVAVIWHLMRVLPFPSLASMSAAHPMWSFDFRCSYYAVVVMFGIHMVSSVEQLLLGLGIKPPKAAVRIIQIVVIALMVWSIAVMLMTFGGK